MGSTTPIFAYPYPVGTDRVMDGDDSIKALAQRIELKGALRHAGNGFRLDGGGTIAHPSQPDGLMMFTGLAAGMSFSGGVGPTINFPGTGFPNGVLFIGATTYSGTGVAPVLDSGPTLTTKTGFRVALPGVTATVSIAYVAIGY